ncbi:MAG: response regulator transcription factor [Dehalococcoidales bacterium]|jgi:DNA-binding response OmpR family regulator|nr:response regulator transcription factor [Dehalococcoidales bacterium]
MKALIIEDNENILKEISFYLRIRYPDISLITAREGSRTIQLLENEAPDFLLLDSSLPDVEHFSLINRIRRVSGVPLLVLTDLETDVDRARSLEVGADDYVTKPISPIELLARINALLRRVLSPGTGLVQSISLNNDLQINFTTFEVHRSGESIKLTPIEFKLLKELVLNRDRILTHEIILQKVWGTEYSRDRDFVKKYICRLRSKLKLNGNGIKLINERGIGYRLVTHY